MLLFVYGTLKQGKANHGILRSDPATKFIGPGSTYDRFAMYSAGGFPVVVEGEYSKQTFRVEGEVYDVTEKMLARLDILEQVPDMYTRKIIPINMRGARNPLHVHDPVMYLGNERYWSVKHNQLPLCKPNDRNRYCW